MIKILYETKDIIVAVKPRGVQAQKSNGSNMIDMLSEATNGEIFPVHRLDTATGGVMVYAKTKKTAAYLSKAFAEDRVEKEYLAIVSGDLDDNGEYFDYLWHDKIKNKAFVVKNERKGAKSARLRYNKLDFCEGFSLVKIKLETGRTHQIRIQFASRRHPLAGDGKYGGKSGYPLALWCYCLSFPDMESDATLSFCEAPPEGEELWHIFQKGV